MLRMSSKTAIALTAAVLGLTACGGGGGETDAADSGDGATGGAEIAVTGTDGLKFSETELSAAAGEISVALTCEQGVPHTFVIEESDALVSECSGGETDTGTVALEAGEYTFYCDVPGHRENGMEGTLTVG